IVDGVADAFDRSRKAAGILQRALGGADQIATAMEVQHDIAAWRIRRRDTPSLDVAKLVLDGADAVREREIRGEEALIGLAQAVVTARDVLGTEREFPEIEGALAFRALQPLAFAEAGDIEYLAGRAVDGLDHVIGPRKAPAGLSHRVDPR